MKEAKKIKLVKCSRTFLIVVYSLFPSLSTLPPPPSPSPFLAEFVYFLSLSLPAPSHVFRKPRDSLTLFAYSHSSSSFGSTSSFILDWGEWTTKAL